MERMARKDGATRTVSLDRHRRLNRASVGVRQPLTLTLHRIHCLGCID